jgi:nicotinamide mononucleotide transporter PnuC
MKLKNPFRDLTPFEWGLYISSLIVVTLSYFFSSQQDVFNFVASLVGVTALIFIAKGYVIGQILTIIFSTLYGIISFKNQYYGEVITYMFMTAPMAVAALISWIRHPYRDTKEVEVHKLNVKEWVGMIIGALVTTFVLYFVLAYFGTANLYVSTLSITTSFMAVYLTFFRSPYYALGYSLNDLVLITLWILATLNDPSCLPVVFCFVMFFANDIYGFINWRRMEKRQVKGKNL